MLLTALDLQRARLGVKGKAAEVHAAHGRHCDSVATQVEKV